jgi:hypothetical protein
VFPKRLDCALVDIDWLLVFLEAYVEHLPWAYSDLSPLLPCYTSEEVENQARPFKFYASWATHQEFEGVVKNTWVNHNTALPEKLWDMKKTSVKFNKDVFGNIRQGKWRFERQVKVRSLSSVGEDSSARALGFSHSEELMWYKKSREKWVKFGDRNRKLFHAQTIVRR